MLLIAQLLLLLLLRSARNRSNANALLAYQVNETAVQGIPSIRIFSRIFSQSNEYSLVVNS
jgi:hypothetical protein